MVQASSWSQIEQSTLSLPSAQISCINAAAHEHADNWGKELQYLAQITKTEPHAAHAALTHGLRGRWTYVMRTLAIPEAAQLALDNSVAELHSTLTDYNAALADDERALLQLPCRLGGIGVPSFTFMARCELAASHAVTGHQVDEIIHQHDTEWQVKNPDVIKTLARREKASSAVARRKEESRQYGIPEARASPTLARRMTQLSSKGASIWLTALPLWDRGCHLSKGDFRDTLTLRYGWQLKEVLVTCGCGEPFTTTHAMCCSCGGFPTIRHKEVRDLLAEWLTEVCSTVAVEPQLAPLSGEVFVASFTNTAPDAHTDVRPRGF